MGSKPTAGDACLGKSLGLGTSDAPKDQLLERDGKSLDIGPSRSPFALARLGDIPGKRQRSQGSLEPWEGYFGPTGCPANVTPAKWGDEGLVVGGSSEKLAWMLETKEARGRWVVGQDLGGGPLKQRRDQRDCRVLTRCFLLAKSLCSTGGSLVLRYSEFPCNYYIYAQHSRMGYLSHLAAPFLTRSLAVIQLLDAKMSCSEILIYVCKICNEQLVPLMREAGVAATTGKIQQCPSRPEIRPR